MIEELTNAASIADLTPDASMLANCTAIGLTYLVQLSNIPEEELFKISLNFWKFFANDVMMKTISPDRLQRAEIPRDENNLDFSNFLLFANKITLLHQ
jgi:hypothetical protein